MTATKERLRDAGFVKFVWPNDGHVLVREYERGKVIKIEDEKHLSEIVNAFQMESQTQSGVGKGVEENEGDNIENEEEVNTRTIQRNKWKTQCETVEWGNTQAVKEKLPEVEQRFVEIYAKKAALEGKKYE